MTYTHHFILQSVSENGLLTKDVMDDMYHDYVRTVDVEAMETHWEAQYGTPMIVTNVYVTEDV